MRKVLLALALVGGIAQAAPAPYPVRGKTPALRASDLEGVWSMDWGLAAWRVELRPGGDYRCRLRADGPGDDFVGSWQLGAPNTLVIDEVSAGSQSGSTLHHEVRLCPVERRGNTREGTAVRLRRWEKR